MWFRNFPIVHFFTISVYLNSNVCVSVVRAVFDLGIFVYFEKKSAHNKYVCTFQTPELWLIGITADVDAIY